MHFLGSVNDAGEVIVWSLVLIGLVLGAFVAVVWIRRRVMDVDQPGGKVGFSLSALKELYRKGQMTQEEFEKAKAMLIDGVGKGPEVLTEQQKARAAAERARREKPST